ncbi:Protein-disulfide isomerase [Streptomyces sp. 2224.1]|uniref:thioredoxin domain-containing protein n=1 Tax=unclassified Streptomyces TaxID=2593676 RepID=UPI0008802836|nr:MULTISPECIES: thioredoxin domain-containing protein [unclassified Streptomyces]PBC81884.1 protein-disulfide isomerase [Streptomyces sp. 2321.6]SDR52649.1 Protein-disulfide isomerase [Streptomyces sp. KS_16]SEC34622.1 Protein-disulfide isomerase [Streptomyces sp. 2133.1]SEC68146.1 Protein-disulfide isomerase [Streptomyces sp. 2224.1]SNC66792.1 Protein-disulfide isomerase [Streptomyces sp. 2114.4]
MSNRNNQANKQAARERLRAERERQAKKDKIRRQLIVGGAIVGVLAIAGGIGVAVSSMDGGSSSASGDSTDWAKAAKAPLTKPHNTSGKNGTTVVVGKKDAKNTLNLFEDPRCPGCAAFEQNVGATVEKDIKDGKYKASYHLGTFLDANLKGTGSKNALSALGAALDVSPDAFLKYKYALYSKEFHPDETGPDKFADDSYLIKVADTIPALKGNAAFQKAVKSGTYDRWAMEMSNAFSAVKDVTSTPTIKLNDTVLGTDSPQGKVAPSSVAAFNSMVDKALKK